MTVTMGTKRAPPWPPPHLRCDRADAGRGDPAAAGQEILKLRVCPGPAEFSEEYGYGLINAYWAVNAVEEMRLVVGRRTGNRVEVVKETTLPAKGGSFELIAPPGEYQIMAWVDVQRTGDVLEPGTISTNRI